MVLSYDVLCWVGLKIFLYIYNFGDKELVDLSASSSSV